MNQLITQAQQRSQHIMSWEDIPGWFNFQKAYDEAITNAKDDDVFIEIGCFLGKSTAYMAQKIKESGKKINFYVIDPLSSDFVDDKSLHQCFQSKSQYSMFIDFFRELDLLDQINLLQMTSDEAFTHLKAMKAKFIFIDGSHEFDQVNKDIANFKQLMQADSTIGGDDFYCPDVAKAVELHFGKGYSVADDKTWPYWTHQNQSS